jgi:hypothetical protein
MQVLCQIYDLQMFFVVIGLSFHHLNRVIHSAKVLHFYEGCFNSSSSSLSVSYLKTPHITRGYKYILLHFFLKFYTFSSYT